MSSNLPAKRAKAAIVVAVEVTEAVTKAKAKASQIADLARAFAIHSDEDATKANACLQAVHRELKALEDERQRRTAHLVAEKKAIDALYAEPKTFLETGKAALSRALGTWQVEQARAKAALVAASTAEAQTPEERRALIVAGTEEAPKLEGLRPVTTYEVRLVDESKVERACMSPDLAKARAIIEATGGETCPAGFAFEKIVKMVPTGR